MPFGHRSDPNIPERTDYHQTWACVTMNEDDLLRFIQFSKEELDAIRSVILSSWTNGIQKERDYHGSWEFKLKGNPWQAQGNEAVSSRLLICRVLGHLYEMGWILVSSADISKKPGDKDTLMFRRHGSATALEFFAVSFNELDKLRFIGAPEGVVPAIREMLGPILQSEKPKDGSIQFKLHGDPWVSDGNETVTTRTLLMNILQTLESRGFRMYASINQSSEEIEQMDTWYVCRPQGWSLGQVVYGDLFPTATPYGSDSKPGGYMREPAPGGYGGVPGGYGGGTPGGYHPPAPAPAPQVFPQAPYGSPPPPGGVPYGAPTKFPTHAAHGLESYACVTMNEDDLLRFIQFSKADTDKIRGGMSALHYLAARSLINLFYPPSKVILTSWPNGIQHERDYHDAWQFKLKGNPWEAQGKDAVTSRMLICNILKHLYTTGWMLVSSADISKKCGDKDTLLFRRHHPAPPIEMFSVSFNEKDKLRLIEAPLELVPAVREILEPLIQGEKMKDGAVQFKLQGEPWVPDGQSAVTIRVLIMNLLQTLESRGFRMYTSIHQSSKEKEEMDTWYVCRQQGWAPGGVVYGDLFPPVPYGGGPMIDEYGGGAWGGFYAPPPGPMAFPQAPYGGPPPPGAGPFRFPGGPAPYGFHAAPGRYGPPPGSPPIYPEDPKY